MSFGGLNPSAAAFVPSAAASAAAEFTPEPRHHKEFRAELDTVAHLCLLHSKESFGRTFNTVKQGNLFFNTVKQGKAFDGSGQTSPSFVSRVCATKCQELLFWLLHGSAHSLLLSHGHPDEGGVTFSILPSDW
jgi:hypothetical protein